MRGRSDDDDVRRGLERGRVDGANAETQVQGYLDEAAVARHVRGDTEAPWLKVPPFPSDVVRLFTADAETPGFIGDYVFTDPIQVTNHRLLTLWIEITAVGEGGTAILSLVPEGARRLAESQPLVFYPIVVIDPLLTVIDLSATVLGVTGFGSRNFRPAELRTGAVTSGQTWRTMIPFDVAPYTDFRFAVGAIVDEAVTASVVLDYSFAE